MERKDYTMNGILPLWKERGMTSHDCVFKLRKYYKQKLDIQVRLTRQWKVFCRFVLDKQHVLLNI